MRKFAITFVAIAAFGIAMPLISLASNSRSRRTMRKPGDARHCGPNGLCGLTLGVSNANGSFP